MSSPAEEEGREIVARWKEICGAYGGKTAKKWGVEKSGLCLLLAWTNELIQQRVFEGAPK